MLLRSNLFKLLLDDLVLLFVSAVSLIGLVKEGLAHLQRLEEIGGADAL